MNRIISSGICQQIVERLPQAVVVVDTDEQWQWANRATFALLGAKAEQLDELNEQQQQSLREWLSRSVIETEDGTTLKKHCIELEEGGLAFLFEPQAVQEAPQDLLTGLASQQAMKAATQSLLSVARRYEKPLSAMLIQIENLAQLPHDQTLLALGQCLKEQLRWADLIARHSNDSFIVVLPETDQQACDVLQVKLQKVLSQLDIDGSDQLPICGVALLESDKRDDIDRLIQRLEEQLRGQQTSAA